VPPSCVAAWDSCGFKTLVLWNSTCKAARPRLSNRFRLALCDDIPQLARQACCTAPSCRGLADGLVTGALPAGSPPPSGSRGFNWQMAGRRPR
jgi:hypothetical protein